jgi:hypothetical protein
MTTKDRVLLISSHSRNGGIYLFENSSLYPITTTETRGFAANPQTFVRSSYWQVDIHHHDGRVTHFKDPDLGDVHDVLLLGDHLFIVSTLKNTVFQLSAATGKIIRKWQYPGVDDSWHLNCMDVWDGSLVVSGFGKDTDKGYWAQSTYNTGFIMNLNTKDVIWGQLSQPHSPKVDGNNQYVCNSLACQLLVRGKNAQRSISFDQYPRGLYVAEDYLYVGLSQLRRKPQQKARLVIVDKETLQIAADIPMPFNEIYDIKLIDRDILNRFRQLI